MNRLKWFATGCLGAALLAQSVPAQSPASRIADRMHPNSMERNPQAATETGVADEPSTAQMVPAAEPGAPRMSGLATSSGKGRRSVDLGKESDDPPGGAAKNIFDDPATLKMLGENPRFVYKADNLRDPMLIPWVRRMAIFKELIAKADQLILQEKYDEVTEIYKRLRGLEDERFTTELATRMAELDKLKIEKAEREHKPIEDTDVVPETVELPAWIVDNTKAVLVGGAGKASIVMVGDFFVKEGDSVPGYKYVKVKNITNKKVTYDIMGTSFDVDLEAASLDSEDGKTKGAKKKPVSRRPAARRK